MKHTIGDAIDRWFKIVYMCVYVSYDLYTPNISYPTMKRKGLNHNILPTKIAVKADLAGSGYSTASTGTPSFGVGGADYSWETLSKIILPSQLSLILLSHDMHFCAPGGSRDLHYSTA